MSSLDILLRLPGRVCSWFLCSHSVWTFSILQEKHTGIWWLLGSEVRGQRAYLWMSSGSSSSWLPPKSSHSRAGSSSRTCGTLLNRFMDRSKCCSFFRLLSWTQGGQNQDQVNDWYFPTRASPTWCLPCLAAGPGPGSLPVPAAPDSHSRSAPLGATGACCSSAGAPGVGPENLGPEPQALRSGPEELAALSYGLAVS